MSEQEWRAFLSDRPRTGKLGVTRRDGRPHVRPIWFLLDDDGSILFNTVESGIKGRAILRDGHVSLCVDDEQPPYAFVVIEGAAEVSRDPAALLDAATRIGGRYMGADRAEEYGRRNGVPGELLVRIRPGRVIARRGISD